MIVGVNVITTSVIAARTSTCPPPRQVGEIESSSSLVVLAGLNQAATAFTLLAACSIRATTGVRCDTKMAWFPFTSATVEPARLDMERWGGGIILSSVEEVSTWLRSGTFYLALRLCNLYKILRSAAACSNFKLVVGENGRLWLT